MMKKLFFALSILFCLSFFLTSCSEETTETSDTTAASDDAQAGTPEACGNGICDSIEEEKGLCSTDCSTTGTSASNGEITDTIEKEDEKENDDSETAASEEVELSVDDSAAIEILDTTLDAYTQIDSLLTELQTAVESGDQEEIEALIAEINSLSDTIESNGYAVLQGTNQEILSATENYRSAGTPWQRMRDAVAALDEGDQEVTFTYSFIIEGTEMENAEEALELKDYQDGSVSNDAFKQEIREAITAWEELFEQVFNPSHGYGGNLEITFTDLGDETGTSTASNTDVEVYDIPGDENLGDLRYGMQTYDSLVTGTPFSPTGKPAEGEESDSSGDVHYNSEINWCIDRGDETSATSVLIVTAHETGHGLAYQHEDDGLMSPSNIVRGRFSELFPDGLIEDDALVAATIAIYGVQAQTTVQRIVLDDGTELELPTVNAATLKISAIKVRTDNEQNAAQTRVEEAQALLKEYVELLESQKTKLE